MCVVLLMICGSSGAIAKDGIVKSVGSYRYPLDVAGNGMLLPFEANWPIDRPAQFKRLVFYVHGSGFREVKHNQSLREALGVASRRDTLLFLPQFLKDKDRAFHKLPDNVLSWAARWQWGDLSSGAHRISSFEIADRVISELLSRYPSIREVVVAGNSGGGQFTQRYAVLSQTEDNINAGGKRVKFNYVFSNPSSYVYLDEKRPSKDGQFAKPAAAVINACPRYNSYGYGLDDPNSYTKRSGSAEIEARLLRRAIISFIGNDDDDEDDDDDTGLDKSCSANLQGAERFERAKNYWSYIHNKYGRDALAHLWRICIPHGVHNPRTIWGTSCGRFYIAGTGACRPSPCPD